MLAVESDAHALLLSRAICALQARSCRFESLRQRFVDNLLSAHQLEGERTLTRSQALFDLQCKANQHRNQNNDRVKNTETS